MDTPTASRPRHPTPAIRQRPTSMLDQRDLRRDFCAILLMLFVVFLSGSLLTYDPADPVSALLPPFDRLYQPDVLVSPPRDLVANACGRWGALAADMLFNGLGYAAFYLLLSLAVLDIHLLFRRDVTAPALRFLGWGVSLAGVASLAGLAAPTLSPGPMLGAGGAAGSIGAHLLRTHFAIAGGVILCLGLVLAGLLLCTDRLLPRIGMLAAVAVTAGVAGSRKAVGAPWLRRSATRAALDQELSEELSEGLPEEAEPGEEELETEASDDPELAEQALAPRVRIRGRQLEAPSDEESQSEDAVDEGEEEEEEWDEEKWAEEEESLDDESLDEAAAGSEASELVVKQRAAAERTDEPHEGGAGPRVREPRTRSERDVVMQRLNEDRFDETQEYELPALDLLLSGDDMCFETQAKEVRAKAKILERTFQNFGLQVKVVEIETGPVIAQYEVELEAGLRLSKITGLADDLAIALRVPSVRIVAPIPGKNTVGIEVPNSTRQVVRIRDVIEETNGAAQKMRIPLFLGKDVSGNPLTADLSTLPHLLIAGRTGTGKSVCLNAIISSILMTKRPDEVRMLMIDPKMVELSGYGRLPHLMHPVVTDMKKAEAILAWAVDKMEERYSLLARAGVRHISSYNQLGEEELFDRLQPQTDEERESIPVHLPFIVIVADEMADLMMTAGKEVEQHIIRLAQKSRAVGIHLILATQKPTVDVITGLIKSNLPARISFQVASRTDSRVVLDEMGADKLLGNGDMLFLWPGTSTLLRGQGTYLSDDEIDRITDFCSKGEQNFVNELVNMKVEESGDGENRLEMLKQRDELYESAIDVVVRERRGSISLLQRALGIGYGRAARLIDFMAEDGIVGTYAGSSAREVVVTLEDWERMQGLEPSGQGATAPLPLNEPSPLPAPDNIPAARSESPDRSASAAPPEPTPAEKRATAATAAARTLPRARRNRIRPNDGDLEEPDDETLVESDSRAAAGPRLLLRRHRVVVESDPLDEADEAWEEKPGVAAIQNAQKKAEHEEECEEEEEDEEEEELEDEEECEEEEEDEEEEEAEYEDEEEAEYEDEEEAEDEDEEEAEDEDEDEGEEAYDEEAYEDEFEYEEVDDERCA